MLFEQVERSQDGFLQLFDFGIIDGRLVGVLDGELDGFIESRLRHKAKNI